MKKSYARSPVQELDEVRQFNLMFSTEMGSTSEGAMKIYLRPETAGYFCKTTSMYKKTGRVKKFLSVSHS